MSGLGQPPPDRPEPSNVSKLPPQSPEMEAHVLGASMLDREACARACALLQPADFYRSGHRLVFESILALQVETGKVDQALVRERLAQRSELEAAGGVAYVADLVDSVPTTAHVEQYAQAVRACALKRRIIRQATGMLGAAFEPGREGPELLAEARSALDELDAAGGGAELPRMSEAYSEISELGAAPPAGLLRPEGFGPLLDLLPGRGLWRGLYVIGGAPGIGKTTLTMQLVEACLREQSDLTVLYISGEMGASDLYLSCVCRATEIDYFRVLAGELNALELEAYRAALVTVGNVVRRVRFSKDVRVDTIPGWIRRYKPGLVVVDYFQQLRPGRDYHQAKDRVDAAARAMCETRDRFPHLPFWLLASHSRGDGKRAYAPGRGYGAYKETGDIEYSADRCFNLDRTEEGYKRWREGKVGEAVDLYLVALKNRLGRLGRVAVTFVPATQSFVLHADRVYAPAAAPAGEEGP